MPERPTGEQSDRLKALLTQGDHWILRPHWERFLEAGGPVERCPIERLTRDHRVAATAWLRQQRHKLFRALDGGDVAPDGWLEDLPLYRALAV